MFAELLICLLGVAPMNCDSTNAIFHRKYEVSASEALMCVRSGVTMAASDKEALAILERGGSYPKVRCSIGGAGQRA